MPFLAIAQHPIHYMHPITTGFPAATAAFLYCRISPSAFDHVILEINEICILYIVSTALISASDVTIV